MAAHLFSWAPGGPVDRLIWKACVPQGVYEIDHATLAARFIALPPARMVAIVEGARPFRTLEEAQAFCEQHWKHHVRDPRDSSSRFTVGPPAAPAP